MSKNLIKSIIFAANESVVANESQGWTKCNHLPGLGSILGHDPICLTVDTKYGKYEASIGSLKANEHQTYGSNSIILTVGPEGTEYESQYMAKSYPTEENYEAIKKLAENVLAELVARQDTTEGDDMIDIMWEVLDNGIDSIPRTSFYDPNEVAHKHMNMNDDWDDEGSKYPKSWNRNK